MFKKRNLSDELTNYLKANLKKGYTLESLRWALVNQGYSRREVEKAVTKAELEMAASAPILKTKPEIRYEIVKSEKEKTSWWKKLFG
jgi:Holliday junction resolvasome RuvABC DNA-binding subunit